MTDVTLTVNCLHFSKRRLLRHCTSFPSRKTWSSWGSSLNFRFVSFFLGVPGVSSWGQRLETAYQENKSLLATLMELGRETLKLNSSLGYKRAPPFPICPSIINLKEQYLTWGPDSRSHWAKQSNLQLITAKRREKIHTDNNENNA